MDAWRPTLMAPWQSAVGEPLLAASALTHAALGLYAIAARRSLALGRSDIVQIALGVAIPPLLIAHIMTMRVAAELVDGFHADYGFILCVYWSFAPSYAFMQLFAVVSVWIHAAIGLYGWLTLKSIWTRIGAVVLPLLFALPIAALMGFSESGKQALARLATDAE